MGLDVFPRMLGITALDFHSIAASRLFYSIAMVPFVQFTRDVFRQGSSWTSWLIRFVMLLLLVSCVGGLATGNMSGSSSPWFWCYFAGYSTAIVWMTIEAVLAYGAARKRLRVGL